jgi:hypothetical protein
LNTPNLAEHLPPSDAAAFEAHKLGATFAFVDCPHGRSTISVAQLKLLEEEEEAAFMRSTAEAPGESLAASFRLWGESDPGSELLQRQVRLAMLEAVLPEAMHVSLSAYPKEWLESSAQREQGMCLNMIDLCSGMLICRGGPGPPRVLAIVGRAHVAPLIALLKVA